MPFRLSKTHQLTYMYIGGVFPEIIWYTAYPIPKNKLTTRLLVHNTNTTFMAIKFNWLVPCWVSLSVNDSQSTRLKFWGSMVWRTIPKTNTESPSVGGTATFRFFFGEGHLWTFPSKCFLSCHHCTFVCFHLIYSYHRPSDKVYLHKSFFDIVSLYKKQRT